MTELRYALRMVRNSPGFATVVVVTLAIGIGANTAIVSLLQTVLLRDLPVKDAEELMFVRTAGDRGLGGAPPYPSFERIRAEGCSFSGMAAFATDELRVECAVGSARCQILIFDARQESRSDPPRQIRTESKPAARGGQ